MPMRQKPIRFDEDSVEKLEVIAAKENRDVSYLVREAVVRVFHHRQKREI